MEVNLFNWGHIKRCIEVHEAITGHRPTHIQVPAPLDFNVMGVCVTLVSDPKQEHVTADQDRCLYHNTVTHEKKVDKKLTPVK